MSANNNVDITKQNGQQLLSREVQEIISNQPNWIIRNGLLMLLFIILIIIAVAWFIKYPEIITTNARLIAADSGEMIIPQRNLGKVKTGQQVLLKFTAYPFQEFGFVRGTIASISQTTTDSVCVARVLLPNGLVTNYQKQLQYHNGLIARCEIILSDMRLLQRVVDNVSGREKK
jgi:Cation efflux system protein CusB domain 1